MCSLKTADSSRARLLSKNETSREQAPIPEETQSAGLYASSLAEGLGNLQPAYFALVMATGIVGIAAQLEGVLFLAKALTWLNALAYIILWLMTGARLALYPKQLFLDLIDHGRGVGFFTAVAGTAVLGSELVVVYARYRTAFVLWILAALLWALLTYTIFTAFTVKQQKPSFAEGINGAWLLAVVATEAVSQLATLLSPTAGVHQGQRDR